MKKLRKRGYGTEAIRLMLSLAFEIQHAIQSYNCSIISSLTGISLFRSKGEKEGTSLCGIDWIWYRMYSASSEYPIPFPDFRGGC